MFFANKPREYVVSYKEIIFILVVFSFILVILYPKKVLEKQVLSENSNYNLSIIYLKNMLRSDPTNEPLMLSLAQKSLKVGKRELSLGILNLLYKSTNPDIRKKAYLLGFKLQKDNYYFAKKVKDNINEKSIIQALKVNFLVIVKNHYYDPKNSYSWYQNALLLKEYKRAYQLLKSVISKSPKNVKYLKEAYYLSERLDASDDSLLFLHTLQVYDSKHLKRWLKEEYNFLMRTKEYRHAERFLLKIAPGSVYWSNELAQFYSARNQQVKSAEVYKRLFQVSSKYHEKKRYYLLTIKTLQAGNLIKMSSNFAYKYQNRFLKEIQMRILLLKLYTSAGDLHKAASLSKKILGKEK